MMLLPECDGFVGAAVALLDVADAALGFLDGIAERLGSIRVQMVVGGGQLEQAARRMHRVLHADLSAGFLCP